MAAKKIRKNKSTLREYAEAIGMALLMALGIQIFIVQAFKIPSGSMIPTLLIGDHLLVNKLAYGTRFPEKISLFLFDLPIPSRWIPISGRYLMEWGAPKHGDVVVFVYPEDRSKDFIKRVIGVGGDLVEIRDKKVYINQSLIDDPHAHFEEGRAPYGNVQIRDNHGPVRVPEGHIFVMGDNRDRSLDSRFWGFVKLEDVKGRAFLIYWSWDGSDRWIRWERIGDRIY